jgi:alpha-L-rhamnosidase
MDPGTNFSESHGWGAQAAVDVLETVLGIRTGSPGAETVEIHPPADIDLDEAEGTVHTQRGPVALEWERERRGLEVELEVPVNVTARVSLPGTGYRAGGPSRARFVGIEDGRSVFEVGSGRSTFEPEGR